MNDEALMTNDEGMTKPERFRIARDLFVIRHSVFLRHSSFVIRHFFPRL
jgi:hypothetical protein